MDRENTPLKQRQKRGGNAARRSSTSSAGSSAAANGKSASTSAAAAAASAAATAANSAAAAGGASARAFRANSARTRAKTPSSSATSAGAAPGVPPAMILTKHPPSILKATPGLYNPDAPPVMRSSPPPPAPQSRYSEGSTGYPHVNARQQQYGSAAEHAQLYARHSTGGGEGHVRTLYQPSPSSSPSVKKMSQQHHVAGVAAAGPPAPTLLRPQTSAVSMSSDAHASTIVVPPTSVKLITPQYQFATDLSSKLSGCLELTNFTVVGVLGFDGVGKSTLLSLLHSTGDRAPRKQRESPVPSPRSKKASGSRATTSTSITESIFSSQSFDKVIAGDFETTGVDMAVCHDPTGASRTSLVLLDTQPMLSSAMLCELLNKNESPRFGALTPEQQVEVHSFQLATFLLSICHYVVIAHDSFADLQIVRFLQQAESKLQNCRLPHISGGVKEKHVAKLLFVTTRLPDAALLYKEQQVLARHVRALEAAWPGAFYHTTRQGSSFVTLQSRESESAVPNKSSQQQAPPIPVLVIPSKPTSSSSRTHGDYDDAVTRWRTFVQRLPNAPSFSRNPATHHAMNLREWLSNASRIFESVRKSGVFTSDFHSSGRDHH